MFLSRFGQAISNLCGKYVSPSTTGGMRVVSWPNIRKLCIVDCDSSILYELIDAVKARLLCGITNGVLIDSDKAELFESDTVAALCSLAKTKLKCHVTSPVGHPFTLAKCVCQKGNCDNDKPRTTEPKPHLHKQRRNRETFRLLKDSLLTPTFWRFSVDFGNF